MAPNSKRAYPDNNDLLKQEFDKIRSSADYKKSVQIARNMIEKRVAGLKRKD